MNPSDSDNADSPNLPTTSGGCGTAMRTRSAIGQLPAMTPTSPRASPDPTDQLESVIQQLVQAMSTSSSSSAATPSVQSPISATLAAPLVRNNIDIDRKISSKEYRATQSSMSEGVVKCQINVWSSLVVARRENDKL